MSNSIIILIAIIILLVVLLTRSSKKDDLSIGRNQESDIIPSSEQHSNDVFSDEYLINHDIKDDEINNEEELCSVVLIAVPEHKKIQIIKDVRYITSAGLIEAKNILENTPSIIKSDISFSEAKGIKSVLQKAGAIVQIKSLERGE